jgi:Flp pilus assembly protein TadG
MKGDDMQLIRQHNRSERGQTLLEFALVLPFLMVLGVGVIDVGRAIYYTIAVNNAAAAGVEYGSKDPIYASPAHYGDMKQSAQCDANGGTGNNCPNGILALSNITATSGCLCDNGGGTAAESCSYPIVTNDCTLQCNSGKVVECVQVTTTASFNPIFGYPGLPTSYTANGRAVMRVRR